MYSVLYLVHDSFFGLVNSTCQLIGQKYSSDNTFHVSRRLFLQRSGWRECIFVLLVCVIVCLSSALNDTFYVSMAYYSLFPLKVPLNTDRPTDHHYQTKWTSLNSICKYAAGQNCTCPCFQPTLSGWHTPSVRMTYTATMYTVTPFCFMLAKISAE